MKATIETTTVVHLRLTIGEARWLRELMQNPIHEGEDKVDKKNRSAFFEQLSLWSLMHDD